MIEWMIFITDSSAVEKDSGEMPGLGLTNGIDMKDYDHWQQMGVIYKSFVYHPNATALLYMGWR